MRKIDMTGRRFGRLVVLHYVGPGGCGAAWLCACDCGAQKAVYGGHLRNGRTRSCGCLHREASTARHARRPRKDIAGLRFGRFVVTRYAGNDRHGAATWVCTCDCGTQKVVCGANLRSGTTLSCGCLRREACAEQAYRHGHAGRGRYSSAYLCWSAMKDRCSRPANIGYRNYGGRGIKVCARWVMSFEAFLADM